MGFRRICCDFGEAGGGSLLAISPVRRSIMTHTMHHNWVADERLWLHEVLADRAHGWIGMLEIVSLAALVGISVLVRSLT
jgi:hypothetical protein